MEKKEFIREYISGVFFTYGIIIAVLNIFCLLFGNNAEGISSIFSMGSRGLSADTCFQFLLMAALSTACKSIFMTDAIIKNLSVVLRMIFMYVSVFAAAVICIAAFGWMPTNDINAWIMFILCYGISGTASTISSARREKNENESLNTALEKIKEEL